MNSGSDRNPRKSGPSVGMRPQGYGRLWWLPAALVVLTGFPLHAAEPADCSDPGNLCAGDPCVIGSSLIAGACSVDFGPRTVVIGGRLTLATGATLSLTADRIEVQGSIRASGQSGNLPSTVSLTASGDIIVSGPISCSTRTDYPVPSGLLLALMAGGSIEVHAPLVNRASTVLSASSMTLLDAGADIVVDAPIQGAGSPGEMVLEAGGNIELLKPIRGKGDSFGGYDIRLSAGGNIEVRRPIRTTGDGSEITLTAGGNVTMDSRAALGARTDDRPLSHGVGPHLTVEAGGTIVASRLRAVNSGESFSAVTLRGDEGVTVEKPMRVAGWSPQVTIASDLGSVFVRARVDARPSCASIILTCGVGTVIITAAGAIGVEDSILAGPPGGGDVSLLSTAGPVDMERNITARVIRLEGADVAVGPDAKLSGQFFHLRSSSGDIDLDGQFIFLSSTEAVAAGNLSATGRFQCRPQGSACCPCCLSLRAGGTVDTSAATINTPLEPDCPGSPCGAFLDGYAGFLDP